MDFASYREQYPQYDDLSDQELAEGLHRKYYADMSFEDFSQKIGLKENRIQKLAEGGRDLALEAAEFGAGQYRAFKPSLPRPFRRDEGVEYEEGVQKGAFRAGFSRMDTDAERGAYLDQFVGKGDWFLDSGGRYIIRPSGMAKLGVEAEKPTWIDETQITRYDFADWAGAMPGIVGGTAGAIAATGYGALPAMGLAALSAAGGKAIDETIEALQGRNIQTGTEVAKALGVEAALGATGEAIARPLGIVGRKLLGPHTTRAWPEGTPARTKYLGIREVPEGRGAVKQWLAPRPEVRTTVDPRRIEMGEAAARMGAIPTIRQASDAPIAGRTQGMINTIFGGNANEPMNRAAILNRGAEVITDAGQVNVTPGQLGRITPLTDVRLSQRGAGQAAKRQLTDLISNTKGNVEQLDRMATRAARKEINAVTKQLGNMDQPSARAAIRTARKDVSDHFIDAYGEIDDLVGNWQVVSTAPLKKMARSILDASPKTEAGEYVFVPKEAVSELSKVLRLGDATTLKQAQTMRTILREAAYDPGILKGVGKYRVGQLRSAVDDSIDSVADYVEARAGQIMMDTGEEWTQAARIQGLEITQEQAKAAAQLLRKTNASYREAMSRFDDVAVERIARDIGKSGAIPDEGVGQYLSRASLNSIQKVKNLVGDETWGRILNDHFAETVARATDESGLVSARSIQNAIRRMGPRFNAMYGRQASNIRKVLRELSAVNGKLDASKIRSDTNVAKILRAHLRAAREWDEMMSDGFFKELQNGSLADEDIVRYIFRPATTKKSPVGLIRKTKEMLGETSPEWMRIRQRAMYELVDGMITKSDDALEDVISGKQLQATITKYSNPVLREMFGKRRFDALREFADVTAFLTSKNPLSGGIVAANIALHPVQNIGRLIWLKAVASKFLDSPTGVRYFTHGLEAPKTRAGSEALSRAAAMLAMMAEDQTMSEADPAGQ